MQRLFMVTQWIRKRISRRLVSSLTAAKSLAKNFRKTRTQMVLTVVVAILAILPIVFVGIYIYISHLLCLHNSVNLSILVIVFPPLFLPFIFILAFRSLFSFRYFAVDTSTPKWTIFNNNGRGHASVCAWFCLNVLPQFSFTVFKIL